VSDESETTVFAVAVAFVFAVVAFAVVFAFVIGPGFSLDISVRPKAGFSP
jgi:hypothetical protein